MPSKQLGDRPYAGERVPGTRDSSLCIEVITSFEEASSLRDEWDAFVEAVGGDIYLTFDWCRIWWKYYGTGRQLRVFLCRQENRLVGLMPFFVESLGLGLLRLRIAKVLCSDFGPCIVTLLIEKEHIDAVLQETVRSLIEAEKCDAIVFAPFTRYLEELIRLKANAGAPLAVRLVRHRTQTIYSTFSLPSCMDDYIAALPKRQRSNLRRDENLLKRAFHISQCVMISATEPDARAEFDKFAAMHTQQWHAEDRLGHFLDWPHALDFNSDLAVEGARRGRLRLVSLFAGEDVVSIQLSYSFGSRWHWRLPARVVGPEWDKYGLGRVGLVKMLEAAIGEGVEEVEAGPGHYEYKVKLGANELPLYSALFAADKWHARLKSRVFIALADALHFFYYRIWFVKVAPKLPCKRRPLWNIWIRTRF